MARPAFVTALLLIGVLSCGCRSTSDVAVEARPSVGQELQDLEDARSKGLITEAEYQKQRKKILSRDE